jgi:putative glutamine transport system permease protein
VHFSVIGEYGGQLLHGLAVTLGVSALALALALAVGIFIAAMRVSPYAWLRTAGFGYVETVRNIPLLIIIYFLFFGLPGVGIRLDGFLCGVLGLGFYTGAFISEAIRSGILGVPAGQLEAATACGMSYGTAMRLIVLPQAIRATIPPIGNQSINLIKNSSLVSTIAVADILHEADAIGSQTFEYTPVLIAAAVLYIVLTAPTAALVNYLERRAKTPGAR